MVIVSNNILIMNTEKEDENNESEEDGINESVKDESEEN